VRTQLQNGDRPLSSRRSGLNSDAAQYVRCPADGDWTQHLQLCPSAEFVVRVWRHPTTSRAISRVYRQITNVLKFLWYCDGIRAAARFVLPPCVVPEPVAIFDPFRRADIAKSTYFGFLAPSAITSPLTAHPRRRGHGCTSWRLPLDWSVEDGELRCRKGVAALLLAIVAECECRKRAA
jgi:hypothetical protein